MKENDNVENNVGPPEQTSGTDPSVQTPRCSRAPRAKYKHRNHRRTGKVARLPGAIRNEICLMFTRYTEYKDIIAWLASQGYSNISESNLSRWRKGGFRDWLCREQKERLELITMALEVLTELVIEGKRIQPAADQSQPFVAPPLRGPLSSTDNALLTTDTTRSNKPST